MPYEFRLYIDRIWEFLLQNLCNSLVRDLALAAELLLIGCILNQGVLEDVPCVRWKPTLINKFSPNQPAKLIIQFPIIQLGNCPKQDIGKLLSDRRCQLQNIFYSCKLVQSG